MIKVCLVRGKFLNNFEGQNYLFKDIKLTAVSSFFPINRKFAFPVIKLPSFADISGRGLNYICNRILGDSQILFGLEKLTNKFDIFHTADPHYYYSYQLAKLRQKNLIKKLLVTSWETIAFNNETIKKKKEIKYFVLKNADNFLCYTQKAKTLLIKEGVKERKISVIRLGINLDKFKLDKMTRSRSFVNNNEVVILFVGRLVEEKGIMDLYEVYKNIKNQIFKIKDTYQKSKIKDIKLRIIGEGLLKSRLERLIIKDGLSGSVTIEEKKYQEMPGVYQTSDIFVLPSKRTKTWEEQYGMVLVEAMASGLPIIAYDTGAISEIVSNAGILIKEGDKKNFFTSIKRLIEVRDLREKLGRIGRERAERYFDAKKTARQISKLYKSLM